MCTIQANLLSQLQESARIVFVPLSRRLQTWTRWKNLHRHRRVSLKSDNMRNKRLQQHSRKLHLLPANVPQGLQTLQAPATKQFLVSSAQTLPGSYKIWIILSPRKCSRLFWGDKNGECRKQPKYLTFKNVTMQTTADSSREIVLHNVRRADYKVQVKLRLRVVDVATGNKSMEREHFK